jgi:hypothetical protein
MKVRRAVSLAGALGVAVTCLVVGQLLNSGIPKFFALVLVPAYWWLMTRLGWTGDNPESPTDTSYVRLDSTSTIVVIAVGIFAIATFAVLGLSQRPNEEVAVLSVLILGPVVALTLWYVTRRQRDRDDN